MGLVALSQTLWLLLNAYFSGRIVAKKQTKHDVEPRHKCGCSSEVVVITTVNAMRTASILIPSALEMGMALRVYHENSADFAAGCAAEKLFHAANVFDAERLCSRKQRVACLRDYDLHILYPWLNEFATMGNSTDVAGSVFDNVLQNAIKGKSPNSYPKHAKSLTVKAHFIFRKILALRHGVLEAQKDGFELAVWADADVEIRKSLEDPIFLDFATSVDVATIHRTMVRPSPGAMNSEACSTLRHFHRPSDGRRALPDTGFATFRLDRNTTIDFILAWSGYYATAAARRSRCLNDICIFDRLLAPARLSRVNASSGSISSIQQQGVGLDPYSADELGISVLLRRRSRTDLDNRVAISLLPPELAARTTSRAQSTVAQLMLEAWIAQYVGRGRYLVGSSNRRIPNTRYRALGIPIPNEAVIDHAPRTHTLASDLKEGWFALCPEALTYSQMLDPLIAIYRVDMHRSHPCPGSERFVSPFHLLDYVVHAKGGGVRAKKNLRRSVKSMTTEDIASANSHDRKLLVIETMKEDIPAETRRRDKFRLTRWRSIRNDILAHPFDPRRHVDLTPFLQAANATGAPVAAVLEAAHTATHVGFFDFIYQLPNATLGFPVHIAQPELERSTIDVSKSKLRVCRPDPAAAVVQLQLEHSAACGCKDETLNIRYKLEGNIGLGAEVSALLKPFAKSLLDGERFLDPDLRRPGCEKYTGFASCLDLMPVDRCVHGSRKMKDLPSAREKSRPIPPPNLSQYVISKAAGLMKNKEASHFWSVSQLVAYILRPNDHRFGRLAHAVESIRGRPLDQFHNASLPRRKVLGLHVRRGDTCLEGGARELKRHKGRVCDNLTTYATSVRRMITTYGFDALFVATDDAQVATEALRDAKKLFGLNPEAVFIANAQLDRNKLYNSGYYNSNIKMLASNEARDDANALLDDLFLLAHADGLVAKFTSNVARLALALSNAIRGGDCVVPYESLDAAWCADFGRLTGNSINGGPFYC